MCISVRTISEISDGTRWKKKHVAVCLDLWWLVPGISTPLSRSIPRVTFRLSVSVDALRLVCFLSTFICIYVLKQTIKLYNGTHPACLLHFPLYRISNLFNFFLISYFFFTLKYFKLFTLTLSYFIQVIFEKFFHFFNILNY